MSTSERDGRCLVRRTCSRSDGFGIWMDGRCRCLLHGTSVRNMDLEYARRICPGLLGCVHVCEARRVREMEARETHLFTHDQDGFGIWMTMSMSPLHGTSVRDMDWEYAQRICPGLLGLDGRCRSTERSRRIWNRDGRCLLHGTSVRIRIWNTAASLKLFEVTAEGEESVLAFSVSMDDVSCTFVRRTSPRLRDPDGFGIRRPLRRRSCSR